MTVVLGLVYVPAELASKVIPSFESTAGEVAGTTLPMRVTHRPLIVDRFCVRPRVGPSEDLP